MFSRHGAFQLPRSSKGFLVQSLAFPLRLAENGLLRRQERSASVVALLQMMARTPQGSWHGCPGFGFRDLFDDKRLRADKARVMMQRINETLRDLGLEGYHVTEVVRELSPGRDTDTYAITVEGTGAADAFTTSLMYEP